MTFGGIKLNGLDIGKLAGRFKEIQGILTKIKVEGDSNSGAIKIILNGQQDVLAVRIFPQLMGTLSKPKLEKELLMTFNQTLEKSKDEAKIGIYHVTGVDMNQFNHFF